MKPESIKCDVMVNGRFYLQFNYPHASIFVLKINDIYNYAREKFESLRNKEFTIEINTNRICRQK